MMSTFLLVILTAVVVFTVGFIFYLMIQDKLNWVPPDPPECKFTSIDRVRVIGGVHRGRVCEVSQANYMCLDKEWDYVVIFEGAILSRPMPCSIKEKHLELIVQGENE